MDMTAERIHSKRRECAGRLQDRLGLSETPEIRISGSYDDAYDSDNGLWALESRGRIVVHPPGYYSWFKNYAGLLKAEYYKLNYDLDRSRSHGPYILTLNLQYEGVTRIAGYKWFYTGALKNNERFFAIFFVYLIEMFRGYGLAELLKLREIESAMSLGCDFIQTYLEPHRPHFFASLIPNLKNGFVFQPKVAHREEIYTAGERFVHLRKYLRPLQSQSVEVHFRDGLKFVSPKENERLIAHLLDLKTFKVDQIKAIRRL